MSLITVMRWTHSNFPALILLPGQDEIALETLCDEETDEKPIPHEEQMDQADFDSLPEWAP